MAWTNPRTWTVGEIVSKVIMDTHIRDNLNYLKALLDDHGAAQHTNVTRELWLVPYGATITTAGAGDVHPLVSLPDAAVTTAFFSFKCPTDFISVTSVKAVWFTGAAAGNMYWSLEADYAASGQTYNTHTEATGSGATANGGANLWNAQAAATPLALASLASGDFVGLMFEREGTHVSDTLGATALLLALVFEYTANQ